VTQKTQGFQPASAWKLAPRWRRCGSGARRSNRKQQMAEDREARLNRAAKLLPALVDAVLKNGGVTSTELAKLVGATQSLTSYAITMAVRSKMIGRHWVGSTRQVNYWQVDVARFLNAQDEARRAKANKKRVVLDANESTLPAELVDDEEDSEFVRPSKRILRPASEFLPYTGGAANSVWEWRGQVKVSA
jgi:hypothetical protein